MPSGRCTVCGDTGWVCESHPWKPWSGFSDKGDACGCGAAPCANCNPARGPDEPPGMSGAGIKTDIDKDGWLH